METRIFPSIKTLTQGDHKAYHIDMYYGEDFQGKIPVITFTADDQTIREAEDFGLTGSQLVKTAFENLRNVMISFQNPSEQNGHIIKIEKQAHASEKILDREFLIAAAKALEAERILVGVPVKDSILIADADNTERVATLYRAFNELYNDFGGQQISQLLFEVEEGTIKTLRSIEFSKPRAQIAQTMPEGFSHKVFNMKLFGTLYNVKAIVGAEQLEVLQNGIFACVHNALLEHALQPNFNKTIEIQSEFGMPQKTPDTEYAMQQFFRKLKENPSIQSLANQSSTPVKVTFLFGSDFQSGNVHHKITTLLTD